MSKRSGYRSRAEAIPGWLHLPPGYKGGRIPAVIAIPGMDSFKEIQVALYGDRFLNRGMAVLAIDGPGQYEAPMIGVYFSHGELDGGRSVLVDWLSRRAEIDADVSAAFGTSFGTFFGTILTAHEPRIRAFAAMSVCHEPGCHTIFQEASPTFKKRFMYMSGITDEDEFDKFRKTITWEGHADKIRAPYLVRRRRVRGAQPARAFGAADGRSRARSKWWCTRNPAIRSAMCRRPISGRSRRFWLPIGWPTRLAGKPFASERWYVRSNGQIDRTPY